MQADLTSSQGRGTVLFRSSEQYTETLEDLVSTRWREELTQQKQYFATEHTQPPNIYTLYNP